MSLKMDRESAWKGVLGFAFKIPIFLHRHEMNNRVLENRLGIVA